MLIGFAILGTVKLSANAVSARCFAPKQLSQGGAGEVFKLVAKLLFGKT
jgi:hypothetical protein